MEKNENKTMEKNDKAITTDEPEVNYRGVKAMPFIIGKTVVFCIFFSKFLLVVCVFAL